MLRCSGMFALLRYDGKANRKEPQRRKERNPGHGRIQDEIAANASKNFPQARDRLKREFVILSGANGIESLASPPPAAALQPRLRSE
jgi:hypothetical protein